MREIPVEKRLELIQQVRSQYRQNQCDLQNREQILYGKNPFSVRREEPTKITVSNKENVEENISFFMLRIMGAVVLFLVIFILDISGASLFGFRSENFFELLGK